jgi:flagellar protein FlaF
MFMQAYEEIAADDQTDLRASEREIILQTIDAMRASDANPQDLFSRIKTVHFIREVWSYFLNDLTSPDNEMDAPLKASLISIGIFIIKHLERMRQEPDARFAPILEVSITIERGLG